ncbi:SulP family inorganic anion transporter, partial [Paenibacillus sonchi]|uniref:SulP family inorganic anion transporter n=1 Tax=Paenibacillus sonchi TaxID=373687 RepID=UPI001E2E7EA2
SVINVKSGGRGRLSTLVAGVFLMFLILVLGEWVVQIPMPVLVGIMIMVSIGTFDWSSFTYLLKAPRTDAAVMLVTVIIVVATHDLSKGVIAGVILSAVFFVSKISNIEVRKRVKNEKTVFEVEGQLFFASVDGFVDAFDFTAADSDIVVDFSNAHIWDDSAVGAIDKVVIKYRENNNRVAIKGLNSSSQKIVDKLAIYNDANAKLSTH